MAAIWSSSFLEKAGDFLTSRDTLWRSVLLNRSIGLSVRCPCLTPHGGLQGRLGGKPPSNRCERLPIPGRLRARNLGVPAPRLRSPMCTPTMARASLPRASQPHRLFALLPTNNQSSSHSRVNAAPFRGLASVFRAKRA